ncbi:MAG: TGS domain-containing protein, partial [Patescibacteria group bacterium]
PPDKRLRIATESLEIYAPIADRLGMSKIKGQLEDLSFPHIFPQDYRWLKDIMAKEFKKKEKYLERIRKTVLAELGKKDAPVKLISFRGRTKHIFSLYKKLLRPEINRDISKVRDFLALRLIVPSVSDCYTALGIIHQLFKPMPGHIKDYIAQPKPNGYQSLHTSVFTEDGGMVEFQIRTPKMHEEAEYGIAAHWHYKETGNKNPDKKNLRWIEELIKWQKQIQDNDQFLKDIRLDIFQNRIFVFTPKGDVIDLPENATPLDFAYHVHSSLGDKCVGVRINDQFVSLESVLKSGDIVEIITDKNRKGPNADWLDMVKTSMAKSKIRGALNKQKHP